MRAIEEGKMKEKKKRDEMVFKKPTNFKSTNLQEFMHDQK